jgi:hypothetical protein
VSSHEQRGPNRKRGTKEKPSARKRAALHASSLLPRPGKAGWQDDEIAARVEAVRMLRHLTPSVVRKIIAMLAQPLEALELATLARIVFDRGGVPAVTQMEMVGDQIPQTLVVPFALRDAAEREQDETSERQSETNGTNGTAH